MWPFKKKSNPKPPEFLGVRFTDLDGKVYQYSPANDITPYELALLWPLSFTGTIFTDKFAYIRKHELDRFFKLVVEKDGGGS